MKLDLWKCDRCAATKENPIQLGLPSGWLAFLVRGKEEKADKEKHLCERCQAGFYIWMKGE